MSGEQAYYFSEFVKMAFSLLPIGFILIAMIFLRRAQRTRESLVLQSLAGLWLAIALISRLVLSRVIGLSLLPKDRVFANAQEANDRMNLYFAVSSGLQFAEQAAFVLFAIALLMFFRQRLPTPSPSP
jgi:hypothetical protein